MDFRAGLISGISSVLALVISVGLILVCMLFARASFQPVRNNTRDILNSSIKTIMGEIGSALEPLSAPGLLPNISCSSLNLTKLLALEQQQPLTVHIPTFRCYMQTFTKLVPQLSREFKRMTQILQDMELQMTDKTVSKNCSLPAFEEHLDSLIYAKCFLQLVETTLTNPKL